MAVTRKVIEEVEGEFIIPKEGLTVGFLVAMTKELLQSKIPDDTQIKYEPNYSDIATYPARFYFKQKREDSQ